MEPHGETFFVSEGLETSVEMCKVARKEEIVAAITLEVSFGETQGFINLCYPFRALNSFIDKLSTRPWTEEMQKARTEKGRGNMEAAVSQVPLRLCAWLGRTSIAMQELLQLKRGDVLILNRSIDQMVDIDVGGRTRFAGHLGQSHGKKAVLVAERRTLG